MKEKEINKLNTYISNIEQLGADARYYSDYEKWEHVETLMYSILTWAKKGQKTCQKIIQERNKEENEKES